MTEPAPEPPPRTDDGERETAHDGRWFDLVGRCPVAELAEGVSTPAIGDSIGGYSTAVMASCRAHHHERNGGRWREGFERREHRVIRAAPNRVQDPVDHTGAEAEPRGGHRNPLRPRVAARVIGLSVRSTDHEQDAVESSALAFRDCDR